MDITEFLTARLDEDEAAARAAADLGIGHFPNWIHKTGVGVLAIPYGLGVVTDTSEAIGAHIIRHDPGHVLRDVQGRRRIVSRFAYRLSMQSEDADGPAYWDDLTVHYYQVCCDLAASYAEHPDFDPAWRVDA